MLASSPRVVSVQTLAGEMATGTHGQGLQQSSIADEAEQIRLVLSDGSVRELSCGDNDFAAALVSLGTLGIVIQVTLRTQPFRIFTCHKNAVPADNLESDLLRRNEYYALSKAWWFVDDNIMHVWNAHLASDDEIQRYEQQGREVVEHADEGDDSLNETIEQTLEHMHRDTQIHGKGGKQFRTVMRFRAFTDVTGDIYQLFSRGIAVPHINVEIGVPLERTPAIISKIKRWYAENRPHLHYPIILHCTGASSVWLSPAFDQPTCFLGFVVSYADDGSLYEAGLHFLCEVEKLHWDIFRALRERLDPKNCFSNDYTVHCNKPKRAGLCS